jgi:hypothetical protein
MRPRPATVPAAAARSGLGERDALEQSVGVVDEHERRVGQAHAAADALEQRTPARARASPAAGTRRGRELQRVGDGGDRPALAQLAQQAQAPEVEHRSATLPVSDQESESN